MPLNSMKGKRKSSRIYLQNDGRLMGERSLEVAASAHAGSGLALF